MLIFSKCKNGAMNCLRANFMIIKDMLKASICLEGSAEKVLRL